MCQVVVLFAFVMKSENYPTYEPDIRAHVVIGYFLLQTVSQLFQNRDFSQITVEVVSGILEKPKQLFLASSWEDSLISTNNCTTIFALSYGQEETRRNVFSFQYLVYNSPQYIFQQLTRILASLRSRWTTFLLWMNSSASKICFAQSTISAAALGVFHGMHVSFLKIFSSRLPIHKSNTRTRETSCPSRTSMPTP